VRSFPLWARNRAALVKRAGFASHCPERFGQRFLELLLFCQSLTLRHDTTTVVRAFESVGVHVLPS
jgi:hypothetical protein